MKSPYGSRETPTPDQRLFELLRLQHEALLRVLQGVRKDAPCRNRTYNLMIKSQIRASDLARTEGVYLGFQATNDAELVPPVDPKGARYFPSKSHGVSQLSQVTPGEL